MAAGQGFKTFVTGEVLTAADTNGYLMQGVNVFANAAARTAAITSPQEGQMSYLKDTDSTEYYTGSAWSALGASSWTTFTPTLTGVTQGNGTLVARYNQTGKTVIGNIKFTLGSTSSITGGITATLPNTANGIVSVVGNFVDNFVQGYPVGSETFSSTVYLRALNASSTYAGYTNTSSSVPFSWGTGDWFEFTFVYEAV